MQGARPTLHNILGVAQGRDNGYTIDVLRDGVGIDALAPEWNKLPQSMISPLLEPDWFAAAAHTFEQPAETIALREQGRLVAPFSRSLIGARA